MHAECPDALSPDDGDYLDDGMERRDSEDIPSLDDLVKEVWDIAQVTDPSEYLEAIKALIPDAAIYQHDPNTFETVFAIPIEGIQSTVLITVEAFTVVSGDHFKFSGSIDGIDFSGEIERIDDQIIIHVTPEILGIGLAPHRRRYFVRQQPETQGGSGSGSSQAPNGPLEITPDDCGAFCECDSTGCGCTPDHCYATDNSCPTPPGNCE